ncbi:hypothetical protein BUE93_22195 [Chromobacterium amazonense]|uniref:Chromosome partitioning protein ParA n=1 Tax=Chromobacterium amazonense TaxID=1382803 RepID=A0A2S9WYI1_9NEIS|nr:ParA family protein [Chromobacterium amazonense]PRP68514.1 hypothetical protein BUE93_22195 [Chromobacterium amazonense]
MATIAVVNPKGGAGKSTTVLVLATELAKQTTVAVIDGDPNHPLKDWASGGNAPESLTIISDVSEDTIMDEIEAASEKHAVVLIDLEGTASKIVVLAVSMSDYVLVPVQGSYLDAKQASRALSVINQQERMVQRQSPDFRLPYSILLTRTSQALRSKTLTSIENELCSNNIPVFSSELYERDAFKAMFSYRTTLDGLWNMASKKERLTIEKAMKNANEVCKEFTTTLIRELGVKK